MWLTILLASIYQETNQIAASLGQADGWIEEFFQQKIFLIFFGVLTYYSILWSFARNDLAKKKKTLLNNPLLPPEEYKVIEKDKRYDLSFMTWLNDQKDELIVTTLVSLLLIEFDDFAILMIERYLDFKVDETSVGTSWIYLTGPVVTDLVYRLVRRLRNGSDV